MFYTLPYPNDNFSPTPHSPHGKRRIKKKKKKILVWCVVSGNDFPGRYNKSRDYCRGQIARGRALLPIEIASMSSSQTHPKCPEPLHPYTPRLFHPFPPRPTPRFLAIPLFLSPLLNRPLQDKIKSHLPITGIN